MPKMAQTADNWETGCVMTQMRIKDIAAEAGVSPATVSRYLNNRPGQMTEETRARIAAVIERTGYRPRAAARNLRSSRTNFIGVILADIANPFSSAMLEGLSASAAARGCSLMTAISGNDPTKEAESLTRLIEPVWTAWSSTPAEVMTRRLPRQRDACLLCCSTATLPTAVSIW